MQLASLQRVAQLPRAQVFNWFLIQVHRRCPSHEIHDRHPHAWTLLCGHQGQRPSHQQPPHVHAIHAGAIIQQLCRGVASPQPVMPQLPEHVLGKLLPSFHA
eukprot:3938239-Rhodomonas_salina.1